MVRRQPDVVTLQTRRGSQPPGASWHAAGMTISRAEQPRAGRGVREALVATFRRVMRLYFRDIERLGDAPGPDVRGRVFVANHTNALIDPILVITRAACEISPVAKSTLWSVPGLRWLLDRAGAVPIVRRVDTPDKAAASNAGVFDRIAAHVLWGVLLPPPLSLLAAVAVTSPFAALRWLDAWYQRTRDATPDELAYLARLRRTACAAIDEARSRLPS
jgi:1-acyl-sn-glycerol-3-phosphate acyltransferase